MLPYVYSTSVKSQNNVDFKCLKSFQMLEYRTPLKIIRQDMSE